MAIRIAGARRAGVTPPVLDGWEGGDSRVRRFLREIHQGGCRHFNIGLGPDSNAYHRNHFHFDMGRGPYCR